MADGQIDTSIYKDNVAENPLDMAGKVLDYRNKLLANQQGQQQIQATQIKLAMDRFSNINNAASGLLEDPDLGKKDVTGKLWDTLGRLTKGDAMSAQHAVQFMQQFPDGGTPDGLARQRQAVLAVHAQTLDAWQKGQAYLGQTQELATGGGTKFIGAPAFGGVPQDRGYVPNTLPPTTPQVNPDLSQTYVGGAGNPAVQGPARVAPPIARPQAAPSNKLIGGVAPQHGLYPPAPVPASQAPNFAQRFDASRPGSVTSAAAPGQVSAANIAGGESGKSLADARNRSLNYQQEVNPLEQAIPALEKLGTKGTGPGTDDINHLKSFVLSNVPGANFEGLKNDVETYDKAKKYLTDWVNQNGNSGTNDKLAASFAGSPSVSISNAAAVDVAKTALALRRFKQAQLVAFENSGKPDAEYAKEAGKFAREHDPRAYGFDMMAPAERKKVLESLPKGKRELFMLDVQDAAQNGIIKTPQAK